MENNNIHNNNPKDFSAGNFVKQLLTEGDYVSCDETNEEFNRNNKLPEYYDDDLFKKGQKFFYDNLFANLYNKMMGLLCVVSVPSIRNVLIETKMSNTPLLAYRRYLATILHILIWFDEEPKPGSGFWKSINTIRKMHNHGSNWANKSGLNRISQKDMALTQIGFMGLTVTRTKYLGIYGATEDEMKGFIHFWRVVGYLLGIDDRFNVCRESVMETQEISKIVIEQVFHKEISKKDKDFISLCYYFIKGLWPVAPYLQFKSTLCILHNLTGEDFEENMSKPVYYRLNWFQRLHYWVFVNIGYLLQYYYCKMYFQYSFLLNIWFMRHFPFIAYYYYGIRNATVDVTGK